MNRHHGHRRRSRHRPPAPGEGARPASALSGFRAVSPRTLVLAGTVAAAGGLALANWRAARAAERRFPPRGRFLEVDGVRLHAIRRGRGRPVLYLHGNGTTADDLDVSGLGAALADGFAATAIDRPGYGYSERPRDRLWTARAQARLIAGALDRLGIERPIVVGHSWGALVALALALEHAERVAGLVLLAGYYYPTPRPGLLPFIPPAIPVIGDVLRYTVSPVAGALLLPRLTARMFAPRAVPERFRTRFPLPLSLRPWQIKASAEDTAFLTPSAADLSKSYARLLLPCAILAGDGDAVVAPEDHAVRLDRELPDSTLRLLPGIGHMLHYHAPEAVAAAVRAIAARG